jgi:hypothetical protein
MDTLILLEDDEEHTKTVKEGDIQNPDGLTQLDKISSSLKPFDSAASAALGDAAASLSIAYCNQILRKIVKFADAVMAKERKKPAAQQHDNAEFQIVVEFHQTNRRLAAAITKAFTKLPQDQEWKGLPRKHQIALRVHRVWLVSCESGGDKAQNAKVSAKYVQQAVDMREAAGSGCKTEKSWPRSQPPEYWFPYVYTFSTGDIVHGSLSLSPNHLTFRSTPDWEVDGDGNIRQTTEGRARTGQGLPDRTDPSAGTIYRYDPSTHTVNPAPVPSGAEVDILKNPLHDWPRQGRTRQEEHVMFLDLSPL